MDLNWRFYEEQLFLYPKSNVSNDTSNQEMPIDRQDVCNKASCSVKGLETCRLDSAATTPAATCYEKDVNKVVTSMKIAFKPATSHADVLCNPPPAENQDLPPERKQSHNAFRGSSFLELHRLALLDDSVTELHCATEASGHSAELASESPTSTTISCVPFVAQNNATSLERVTRSEDDFDESYSPSSLCERAFLQEKPELHAIDLTDACSSCVCNTNNRAVAKLGTFPDTFSPEVSVPSNDDCCWPMSVVHTGDNISCGPVRCAASALPTLRSLLQSNCCSPAERSSNGDMRLEIGGPSNFRDFTDNMNSHVSLAVDRAGAKNGRISEIMEIPHIYSLYPDVARDRGGEPFICPNGGYTAALNIPDITEANLNVLRLSVPLSSPKSGNQVLEENLNVGKETTTCALPEGASTFSHSPQTPSSSIVCNQLPELTMRGCMKDHVDFQHNQELYPSTRAAICDIPNPVAIAAMESTSFPSGDGMHTGGKADTPHLFHDSQSTFSNSCECADTKTNALVQNSQPTLVQQLGTGVNVCLTGQPSFDHMSDSGIRSSSFLVETWAEGKQHTEASPVALRAMHQSHQHRVSKKPMSPLRSQIDQLAMSRRFRPPLVNRHSSRLLRGDYPTAGSLQHWMSQSHRGSVFLQARDRSVDLTRRGHSEVNNANYTRQFHQNSLRSNCLSGNRASHSQFHQCIKRSHRSSTLASHLNSAITTSVQRRRFITSSGTRANILASGSIPRNHYPLSSGPSNGWLRPSSQTDVSLSSYAGTPSPSVRSSLVTQPDDGNGGSQGTRLCVLPVGITQMLQYPSPYQSFPERSTRHNCHITIVKQPEAQHRARYQTEGSRGAVKDRSGSGFPTVQLVGWMGQASLQVFVATESGRPRPHPFYQAYLVAGKSTKYCIQTIRDGVNLIEMPFPDDNARTLSVECVGILKLRKSDVDQRNQAGMDSRASSTKRLPSDDSPQSSTALPLPKSINRKTGKARLVFRAILIHEGNYTFEVVQTVSDPILCTQLLGDPEISRSSLRTCGISGGDELFILGKNLGRDCRVIFRQFSVESAISRSLKPEDLGEELSQNPDNQSVVVWHQEAVLEPDFSHQTHLVCRVPAYQGPSLPLVQPVEVQVAVRCGHRWSNALPFTYQPAEFCCFPPAPPIQPIHGSTSDIPNQFKLNSPSPSAQLPLSSGLLSTPGKQSDSSFVPPGMSISNCQFPLSLGDVTKIGNITDESVLDTSITVDVMPTAPKPSLCQTPDQRLWSLQSSDERQKIADHPHFLDIANYVGPVPVEASL